MMRRRATPLACPGFRYEVDSEFSANRIRIQLNEVACGGHGQVQRRQGTHDRRCTAFTTTVACAFLSHRYRKSRCVVCACSAGAVGSFSN